MVKDIAKLKLILYKICHWLKKNSVFMILIKQLDIFFAYALLSMIIFTKATIGFSDNEIIPTKIYVTSVVIGIIGLIASDTLSSKMKRMWLKVINIYKQINAQYRHDKANYLHKLHN